MSDIQNDGTPADRDPAEKVEPIGDIAGSVIGGMFGAEPPHPLPDEGHTTEDGRTEP